MVHVYGLSDSAREILDRGKNCCPRCDLISTSLQRGDQCRPKIFRSRLNGFPAKTVQRLQNYSLTRYHLAEAGC